MHGLVQESKHSGIVISYMYQIAKVYQYLDCIHFALI